MNYGQIKTLADALLFARREGVVDFTERLLGAAWDRDKTIPWLRATHRQRVEKAFEECRS